ncbi:hypothetical protein QQP08_000246, partial [Theobroma cacao]
MSPFKNSRTLLRSPSLRSRSSGSGKSSHWWFPTVSMATLKDSRPFSVVNLYQTLHGFIVFEVAWEDVRGINYSNVPQHLFCQQNDASLALQGKSMRKWEFNDIDQALRSISSWFLGTPTETLTLQRNLILVQEKVPSHSPQGITISSGGLLFDDSSQVFQPLRNIVRGLIAFFTSCNQHRLSIPNHLREILGHPLRLAPHSGSSQQASDQVECNRK